MTEEPYIVAQWPGEEPYMIKPDPDAAMKIIRGHEAEIFRLREALKKIADIKHEDIPSPITPNEANVWTILAMTVGLAEKALKEGE